MKEDIEEEEYIEYETALLAKKSGFQLPVSSKNKYFDNLGIIHDYSWFHPSQFTNYVDAVPQSVLQKWLRDEKDIHIGITIGGYVKSYHVFISGNNGNTIKQSGWIYNDYNDKNNIRNFPSYEIALESGILQTLKQLEK